MMYLKLAAAIAILAALAWASRAIYSAGEQHIQLQWEADKAVIQATADAAIAKATAEKEAALTNNAQVINDTAQQIIALRDLNVQLSSRLRLATKAPANSGAVSTGDDFPGTATGAIADGMAKLDDAIAAALTECAINRANYK